MESLQSAYTGCLLGLAVGDALGFSVDSKSYGEICRDYGPNGLMGYDLVNGYAEVSSHTQIAAFACNGLLLGITRGQRLGRMAPYVRYLSLALREWASSQRFQRDPEKRLCWVCRVPELRGRSCLDFRMPDTLHRERLGTPEEPVNRLDTPGSLLAAVSVGMFFHPDRMEIPEIGRLGMETVALTHGDPMTFLSGAALAYMTAGLLQDRDAPLKTHFAGAADAVAAQFGREYPQAALLRNLLYRAMELAEKPRNSPAETMESLNPVSAPQVLAAAVFACLVTGGDFDTSLITAVNHSGRSAAVGAVAGALLGAKTGREALPEFYLEGLAPAPVLTELAADLCQGCPMGQASRLFDDDWDRKYMQGEPVEKDGWFLA